jgi:hypothetical protein
VAVFRQDIIRYLTDRPGSPVYRSEIAEELGLTEEQVASAVRQFKLNSSIGDEIEIIIAGRAWQYVPNRVVERNTTVQRAKNPGLPMTSLVREYLLANPHAVIGIDDLVRYTGRTESQVRSAVNNLRYIVSQRSFVEHVTTVVAGQMWRYSPPDSDERAVTSDGDRTVERPTRNDRSSVTSTANVAPAIADVDVDDGDRMLFQFVGRSGNAVIIEDEHGVLYRAVPVR